MPATPPIYFYIPQRQWPKSHLLADANAYWRWQNSLRYGQGRYNWTLQTYLQLRDQEFACELVGTLPESGIILAHSDFFPDNLKPNAQQLLVCLRADRNHHPYAQLHVIQNRQDAMTQWSSSLWPVAYMPHWPQSGLIPRNQARGDRFETVAFFGQEGNLAPELKATTWAEQITSLGLNWSITPFERWHDYSDVDVVIAVRSFDHNPYNQKPASKLYNCWHSGVPAILGPEAAYQAERQSDLDYVEVQTPTEALAALKQLRDDLALRQAIIHQGRRRAQETSPAALSAQWGSFLTQIAVPAYEQWVSLPTQQQHRFLQQRNFRHQVQKAKSRLGIVS
jgi:hypothetical protein